MLEKAFNRIFGTSDEAPQSKALAEMNILDTTGHTKTTWDPDIPEEVAAAKKSFEKLTENGRYKAFKVKRDGTEGEPMKKFDSEAGAMILMIPAITSG